MIEETLTLGFARGVAPSKWAKRWADTAANAGAPEGSGSRTLELVPLQVSGRPEPGCEPDVMLERVQPGERPAGTTERDDDRGDRGRAGSRRAVRLYTEAVALVLAADHELAREASIDRATLELVGLLSHPDHAHAWPDPQPWDDPAWEPADAAAALELVASGLGAILLPLPLARHLAGKRTHAVLPLADDAELPGTEIWASWAVDRDDEDVQRLIGILRGRTARSGRSTASGSTSVAQQTPAAGRKGDRSAHDGETSGRKTSGRKKAGPPKNSRGAQLAAAADRQKREKRRKR